MFNSYRKITLDKLPKGDRAAFEAALRYEAKLAWDSGRALQITLSREDVTVDDPRPMDVRYSVLVMYLPHKLVYKRPDGTEKILKDVLADL